MSTDKRKFINGMSATDATDASKRLDIQVNPSQTANKTATLESNVTDNRTITLPNATDTLVGRETYDTLKNKTINANNNTVNVSADGIVATELNSALAELQDHIDLKADASALQAHIDDTTGAHAASAISNTPSGNLIATDVQAALNELQSDVDTRASSTDLTNHINDTTDAHAASAISNTPSGNLAATDVQNALNELQSDVDSRAPINNPSFTGTSFNAVSSTATNISTSNSVSSVNIGTGSGANTITIGSANSTVNILGNVLHETATNVDIKDALITLNKGGAAGSGSASGIEVEEGSSITGYVETSGDRNSWVIKAPNAAGVVSVTPGSTNDTVTLNAASQTLTNKTIGDALTIDGQASTPSTPSAGFYKTYIKDSNGKLAILDSSGNETVIGGGSTTYTAVAGENLNANDAVYIANASDSGRTLGRAYKLDASNSNRIEFAGFVTANANTGTTATINTAGQLSGFTGLTVGEPVFASVTVPGSYQVTVPAVVGQHIIQLGLADSANTLLINGALSATATLVESSNANIGAATGTSLVLGGTLASSAILQADSTSKGFLAPRMTQAQRDAISGPATGLQIYNTSSNKLNVYNGTSWVEVGSGASTGSKNYIANPDFDAGATTNWSLGNVTLDATTKFPSGSPTFGSGASANLTIAAVTGVGVPLSGNYSMLYSSAAATTAGNFVASDAFTIDKEDQAKALKFSFSYQVASGGSNANWSGTTSNSFGVAIYDVTNSQWIQPSGCFSMIQFSGVGKAYGEFQTSASGTQYRLVVYNANASSAAVAVYMDSFVFGPQQISMGPPVTDWVSYTPTITTATGTMTNYVATGLSRRVGDSLEVNFQIRFTGAVGTWTFPFITIPSGLNIDTAKFAGTNDLASMVIGSAGSVRTAVSNQMLGVRYNNTTTVTLISQGTASTYEIDSNVSNTVPVSWSSGDVIWGTFKVPISGWSSNTVMSSDAATNVVAARLYRSSNQTINTNNNAQKITFDSATYDTNSGLDAANSRYIAKVSGFYKVTVGANVYATNVAANAYYLQIYKNGTLYSSGPWTQLNAGAALGLYMSENVPLNAGDYVEAYFFGAANNSVNTLTLANGGGTTFMNIERISGPAQISAASVVAASITPSAQTWPNGTQQIVSYTSKTLDTTNSFDVSTKKYTVPISGIYEISARLNIDYSATVSCPGNIMIYKNGGQVTTSPTSDMSYLYKNGSFGTFAPSYRVSTQVTLFAGDIVWIEVVAFGSASTGNVTMNTYNGELDIKRLGGVM